jgi:murein L,D-transpeptidase YafK
MFPFRMTEANFAAYATSRWYSFWQNLKEGFDAFKASETPPGISVCRGRYVISEAANPDQSSPISVVSDACSPELPVVTPSEAAPALHDLVKRHLASSQLSGRRPVHANRAHLMSRRAAITAVRHARASSLAATRRVH